MCTRDVFIPPGAERAKNTISSKAFQTCSPVTFRTDPLFTTPVRFRGKDVIFSMILDATGCIGPV